MSRLLNTFQPQKRAIVNKAYRKWFRDKSCSVIGCNADDVVLHHCRVGVFGMNVKHEPHSYPLCSDHHRDVHAAKEADWIVQMIFLPTRERVFQKWEKGR